ncbi:hypothetical protein Avbf_02941 [Armadillidium vulgare]|nr:hypothetical protein Avbf_02941 [Armadillidium vulgare]
MITCFQDCRILSKRNSFWKNNVIDPFLQHRLQPWCQIMKEILLKKCWKQNEMVNLFIFPPKTTAIAVDQDEGEFVDAPQSLRSDCTPTPPPSSHMPVMLEDDDSASFHNSEGESAAAADSFLDFENRLSERIPPQPEISPIVPPLVEQEQLIDHQQLERELELDLDNMRIDENLDAGDLNIDEEDLLAD